MYEIIECTFRFGTGITEIAVCYVIICDAIVEKGKLRNIEKVLFGIMILLLGSLLAINRKYVFISHTELVIRMGVSIIAIWIVKHDEKLLSAGVVTLNYLLMTFIEMILAFLSMIFLKEKFDGLVFYHSSSIWKDVICFAACVIFIEMYRLNKNKIKEFLKEKEFLRKILIALNAILLFVFREYHIVMDEMAMGVRKMQGGVTGLTVFSTVAITIVVAVIFMKYSLVKKENKMYLIQDEMYRKHCEEIERLMQRNNQQYHDMKNHLSVIKKLCNEQQVTKIKEYVNQLCSEFVSETNYVWTGNRIIDIVLNQKMERAKQQNIETHLDVMMLPELCISETELCAVFGNLFDNAIEACEKIKNNPYINVKIEMKHAMFFLTIENSCETNNIRYKEEFVTTKENKSKHGYGLKSVKKIVDKYDGEINYEVLDKKFKINIIFFDVIK